MALVLYRDECALLKDRLRLLAAGGRGVRPARGRHGNPQSVVVCYGSAPVQAVRIEWYFLSVINWAPSAMPRLRPVTSRPRRIEGYAIVSMEGMIADATGEFPPGLKSDADYKLFHDSLGRLDACVHGRHSHEGGPDAAQRARLVVTRKTATLEPDPSWPRAMLWNPAGAPFADAWRALAIPNGVLAVIGGTEVFGLFLEIGYDAFHLTRTQASVPSGRPVFPDVPTRTPEQVLASFELKPGPERVLDLASGVAVVTWSA
jgi:dihydrofolate reductase